MFSPTRYIQWAIKFYGQVPYDLATSGIPNAAWSDIGVETPDPGDLTAYAKLPPAIARHTDMPVENVVPALGTSNAIYLAYASILSAGDEILVETPGYEPLTRTAQGLGAIVHTFERRAEDGFRIVPERVAAQMTPRTRAIVVTTLHNPTGVDIDAAEIRALAAIADAQGAYLIVDEVYAPFEDLTDDGVFRSSARKLAPNIIAISSLTKCWGLSNYRVGWVLGPEAVIESARAASVATWGHLPLTHAAYAVAVFGGLGTLAKRSRAIVGTKRELAAKWVASLPNAHWSAPTTGLFGLVTLPGRGDLRPRIEETATKNGVLVGAGSFFGAPESFRLAWASTDAAKFSEGLSRLEPMCRA